MTYKEKIFLIVILLSLFILTFLLILRNFCIYYDIKFKPIQIFSCWIGWHWELETKGYENKPIQGRCLGCNKEGIFDGKKSNYEVEDELF